MKKYSWPIALVAILTCSIAEDALAALSSGIIIAHRGNSSRAPENTLASIHAAAGVAHMTEFDVRTTADGVLVLMHDATVNRTTNGSGSVSNMDYYGQIDQLDAGSWSSSDFAGEPVPTLQQAVTTSLSHGLIQVPQLGRKMIFSGSILG
jgi:glycerophosphoryl diester phosphodiesterase